jgi:transcriptional regulator with XRE-family HTH domain
VRCNPRYVPLHLTLTQRVEIGDRLRAARELADLTQAESADAVGISRNRISLYERGQQVPQDPAVRQKLADLYNVDIAALFREIADAEAEARALIIRPA